jgi:hypothetical protein
MPRVSPCAAAAAGSASAIASGARAERNYADFGV